MEITKEELSALMREAAAEAVRQANLDNCTAVESICVQEGEPDMASAVRKSITFLHLRASLSALYVNKFKPHIRPMNLNF